jgi:hypothetical protein
MAEDFRRSFSDGIRAALDGDLGGFLERTFDGILDNAMRNAADVLSGAVAGLFGNSGGGGLGGLLGSVLGSFVGGRATGGTIPSGSFGIVGERGPEIAVATPGGLGIMSNRSSRALMGAGAGGGTTVPINISIDATGADAAAIARLNSKIDQLRSDLPERIVTTVRDARDRRML